MKDVVKDATLKNSSATASSQKAVIRSRTVPPQVIQHFHKKLKGLEADIEDVLAAEEVARVDRIGEEEDERGGVGSPVFGFFFSL